MTAPVQARLSDADRRRLQALVLAHNTARTALTPDQRTRLGRLTAHVHDALFAPSRPNPGGGDLWEVAKGAISKAVHSLPDRDVESLATYALDGVAAIDCESKVFLQTRLLPSSAQSNFEMQYLRLQTRARHADLLAATLIGILKRWSDSQKGIISNLR